MSKLKTIALKSVAPHRRTPVRGRINGNAANAASPAKSPHAAHAKIVPFEAASEICAQLRRDGKTIVHCHGTFDLIHPGHIVHFEEAKALGDVLVVTITGEKYV